MKEKIFNVTYPWDINGYKPEVTFYLNTDEEGFLMHIVVKETDPLRTYTQHQSSVCKDSCVEWFVNFQPEICDRYFNLEVNANGAMYAAFRKDRYDSVMLAEEDIEGMDIQTEIHQDTWEVRYRVPFALIQKYIPGYEFKEGMTIRGNFYKCGDCMTYPHYGMWDEFQVEKPDFHRPDFFWGDCSEIKTAKECGKKEIQIWANMLLV